MIFNQHSGLSGKHAFLSPSYYHWLNYDDHKLEARFWAAMSSRRGTDLHNLAHECIRLGVKLSPSEKALAAYVKDGIGYKMICEQTLYYSDNCYGTADTICFRRNRLRIHDLKTGISATSVKQLEIYAALFCLEYGISPFDIETQLRIYQREETLIFDTLPEEILFIMERIVESDRQIEMIKEGR